MKSLYSRTFPYLNYSWNSTILCTLNPPDLQNKHGSRKTFFTIEKCYWMSYSWLKCAINLYLIRTKTVLIRHKQFTFRCKNGAFDRVCAHCQESRQPRLDFGIPFVDSGNVHSGGTEPRYLHSVLCAKEDAVVLCANKSQ